jgi:hypothetical protein
MLRETTAVRAAVAKFSADIVNAALGLQAIDGQCIQDAVASDAADMRAALQRLQPGEHSLPGDDILRARLQAMLEAAEKFGRDAVAPQCLLVLAGLKGEWRCLKSPALENSGLGAYQDAFVAATACALQRAEVDHTFAQLPREPRQLRTGGAAPAAGAVPQLSGRAAPAQPIAAQPLEAAGDKAARPVHNLRKAVREAVNLVLGPHVDSVEAELRSQGFCLYTDYKNCVVEEGQTSCKRALTPGSSGPYCTRMRAHLPSWPPDLPMVWVPNVNFRKEQLLAVAKVLLTAPALAGLRTDFLGKIEPALRASARFVAWQFIVEDKTSAYISCCQHPLSVNCCSPALLAELGIPALAAPAMTLQVDEGAEGADGVDEFMEDTEELDRGRAGEC